MVMSLGACIAVPLLLVWWNGRGVIRRSLWPAMVVIVAYGSVLARLAGSNVKSLREWDFGCFWLYGQLAAAHLNVYDPAVFARFALPFVPSPEFRAAVLDVGFPYPPPTIALFVPLTLIHGLPAQVAVWYIVNFAALGGAAWILSRALFPGDGWRAAPLVLALVLALPASYMTVNDAQTNFLALLLVALAFAGRSTALGSVWQTLAIWVKPYTAALFLLDIIGRRGGRIAVAAVTALGSIAVGALLVGPAAITSYLHANPSSREPAFAFFEVVNQSLLAIVLRLTGNPPEHVWVLHEPLYVVGALVMSAFTIGLCVRARRDSEAAFSASLLLGLLIYPGSLSSYGVVLILPLLVLWRNRAEFPGGATTVGALTAVAVLLQTGLFERGFEANLIVWLACLYLLVVERGDVAARHLAPSRVVDAPAVEVVS